MLQFYVYITLEKDCKKLPSFLFWRAFMLVQTQKEYCKRHLKNKKPEEEQPMPKVATPIEYLDDISPDDLILNSPIKVLFGRPNFKELFKSFIEEDSNEFHVYSTTSPKVNNSIFDAAKTTTKETGVKFHHIYEAT
jgi:hypothetical protein